MFRYDQTKTGRYLETRIKQSYKSVRRFCIAYLKMRDGEEPEDDRIGNMQNKMSQIIQGKKGIQLDDIPYFCDLLKISCEELLSAGRCAAPHSGHVTNYDVAYSRDEAVWREYIEREDRLILNPDEYNKTVIDYAFDFRNYALLKFLTDNKYIWFVDDAVYDFNEMAFGFGAGTSITRQRTDGPDLDTQLRYECEKRGLRQKMIALALENCDLDMLTELRAREIPTLYAHCLSPFAEHSCGDCFEEEVIDEIVRSDSKVLDYFSQEFVITDKFGYQHRFLYPYMQQILERLIKNNSKYAEVLLRRSIEHNEKVLEKLSGMVADALEAAKASCNCENYKVPAEDMIRNVMWYYKFTEEGLLSYYYVISRHDVPKFCANVIRVDAGSKDLLLSMLIGRLNGLYADVRDIQPDLSGY